jgi:BirA family transcriptional regulator, biotin operon repressor / biotin---[acetyl-CoA-carboxylase] ligase
MKVVHHFHETIDSTNSWAKLHAHEFDPLALTVVTADAQTAGRGRYRRKWSSPPGVNLYTSFCFFIPPASPRKMQLAQFFTLQVIKVIEELGFRPAIKWPNDLLLSGKKIVGVLCEITSVGEECCVIAGVGININVTSDALKTIDRPVTSLFIENGKIYSVDEILNRLSSCIVYALPIFISNGFEPFFEEYRSRLILDSGCQLRNDGSLLVLQPSGESKISYSLD